MIPATNLQEGLNNKEWRRVVDTYLLTQKISCGDYEQLDIYQHYFIQTLKRAFKRLKANG